MENPAKRDDFSALTSYFSDNNDLMAERSGFEHVVHVILCQQVTCFHGFAVSLFPIYPRSHERASVNRLACQRVTCELDSLAVLPFELSIEVFLPSGFGIGC
jgi:hypothetical protein